MPWLLGLIYSLPTPSPTLSSPYEYEAAPTSPSLSAPKGGEEQMPGCGGAAKTGIAAFGRLRLICYDRYRHAEEVPLR